MLKLWYLIAVCYLAQCSLASNDECGSELKLFISGSEAANRLQGPHKKTCQGLPGKRGAHGKKGEQGERGDTGEKGEKGEITLSVPELDQIREELKVLKDVNRVFKLFVNDQLEQNIKMSEKLDLVYKLTNEMVEKSLQEELQYTMKTCADLYKNDPTMMSGIYTVYPTSRSSVTVFCRIANTTAITVMNHNSESEMSVHGYEDHESYSRIIVYENSMNDIKDIIRSSTECRQFIKYKCKGSMLFDGSSTSYAAWYSKAGDKQNYWGGTTRPNYCACGEQENCIDESKNCNCDINEISTITSDEGYLNDMSLLPVIKISFGDTGDSKEKGWHTLGPLECF